MKKVNDILNKIKKAWEQLRYNPCFYKYTYYIATGAWLLLLIFILKAKWLKNKKIFYGNVYIKFTIGYNKIKEVQTSKL